MPFMTYLTRHHHQHQQNNTKAMHNSNHHDTHTTKHGKGMHIPSSSSSQHKRREVGEYILGKTIGRGASGRVKIGIHRHTGEQVAIKVISRSQLATSSTMARCVQRELAVLQLLHHPHLVDLRQVLQDASNVYFVMEYVEGGELFQVLSERGRLSEPDARHLFRQLTTALAWCHAHHICHRDLKPENILLDKDHKTLKIADFGMATIQSPNELLNTSCGSPHYASPEIVRGKRYHGPATDVWSCGVILYAMLTGHLPFDDDNVGRLLAKIKLGRFLPLPAHVSREARDLIKSMLVVDPAKRITLDAVLAHPWLTNKSYLGTDLRFPDALPLYHKTHNPLQDHDLRRPIVNDALDLDGRIWETLKVLWRRSSQEDLLQALTSDRPNVPKLTCRLLQQRAWRQEHGFPTAAPKSSLPPLSEDNGSSIAPMTPPLTPLCSNVEYSSHCLPTTTRDSTVDTMSCGRTVVDMPPTPKSIHAFDLDLSWHSEIQLQNVDACKKRRFSKQVIIEEKQQRHRASITTTTAAAAVDDLTSRLADPMVARYTNASPTLLAAPAHAAQQQLLLQHQRHHQRPASSLLRKPKENEEGFIASFSNWLSTTWDRCMDHMSSKPQRPLVIERPAKHECEAAGKMHQIFEEHFNGKLSGRVYPNGLIVWSGSIGGKETSLHFLCRITQMPPTTTDTQSDQVRISFTLVKGDEKCMASAVDQLLQIWDDYEYDAKSVAITNGWLKQ
ncbi:hypothetical protein O0I10_001233 [Lichtheimia ornata]|uniref:Protein kinase domain-containing protein n=1 Tax=Lichtheimia ornata TaxID=688661 RepID=A0AAD7Y3D5_9FUNG|nr:uncharacterized protein O0I10_001233 [Lichtheimia ornata]KAJ8663056.1 hypothetical protein O0I10_001233 [Lichtheimia ornata]